MAEQILMYKNKPLVRCGDTIYYGYIESGFVIMLKILDYVEEKGMQMPHKFSIFLLGTKGDIITHNTGERIGFTKAMELAEIWLTRALNEQAKR